jgi:hypothetical protein
LPAANTSRANVSHAVTNTLHPRPPPQNVLATAKADEAVTIRFDAAGKPVVSLGAAAPAAAPAAADEVGAGAMAGPPLGQHSPSTAPAWKQQQQGICSSFNRACLLLPEQCLLPARPPLGPRTLLW